MSNPLDGPIEVRQGPYTAVCDRSQFRANITNGAEPPMTTHVVLGFDDPSTGRFVPVEGVRAEAGTPATESAIWDQDDYNWLVGQPAVQAAIAVMVERHNWIVAGRAAVPNEEL